MLLKFILKCSMRTLTFCNVIVFLTCTQTLFNSFFCSFWKHRQASEHALLSPPLPTCTSSHLIPRGFIFYHVRLTDFEEKIEGLWTGYSLPCFSIFPRENCEEQIDCVLIVTRYKVKKMSCARQLTCAQWGRTIFLVEILAK